LVPLEQKKRTKLRLLFKEIKVILCKTYQSSRPRVCRFLGRKSKPGKCTFKGKASAKTEKVIHTRGRKKNRSQVIYHSWRKSNQMSAQNLKLKKKSCRKRGIMTVNIWKDEIYWITVNVDIFREYLFREIRDFFVPRKLVLANFYHLYIYSRPYSPPQNLIPSNLSKLKKREH
jgi:hypothetical protein